MRRELIAHGVASKFPRCGKEISSARSQRGPDVVPFQVQVGVSPRRGGRIMRSRVRVKGSPMSSSSDFATGPAAPVTADSVSSDDAAETAADIGAPEEVETVESDSVKVDGSLADLHRETAAMLRTLAGRYDAEAADKRALAARLRAESDANESLASQLAEESARIRVDADRLGTEPTWIGSVAGGDA